VWTDCDYLVCCGKIKNFKTRRVSLAVPLVLCLYDWHTGNVQNAGDMSLIHTADLFALTLNVCSIQVLYTGPFLTWHTILLHPFGDQEQNTTMATYRYNIYSYRYMYFTREDLVVP
jgi:hypothetical protein